MVPKVMIILGSASDRKIAEKATKILVFITYITSLKKSYFITNIMIFDIEKPCF